MRDERFPYEGQRRSENGFETFVPLFADDDECCGADHDHGECCGGHDHDHDHGECCGGHDHDHGECCGAHHQADRAGADEVFEPYPGDAGPFVFEEDEEEKPKPAWIEPAFAELTFEHEGISYHVRRWGDAAQIPIVLLHGFMQSGDGWWVVAPHLAQDHCVYAFDLIGHGASDKPAQRDSYSLAREADAVAAFLAEVVEPAAAASMPASGIRHRAHLLGYSMGGRVALEVALQHGDLLYSLVLESASIGPVDEGEREQSAQRDAAWAQRLRAESIEEFVSYWETLPLFATQQRLSESLGRAVRAERLANEAEIMANVIEGMGQHTMRLRSETMAMLECTWTPVFYLCGTRDEKYRLLAEEFLKEGFEAKAIMAGHNTHLEAPEYFLDAVRAFFSRVEVKGA